MKKTDVEAVGYRKRRAGTDNMDGNIGRDTKTATDKKSRKDDETETASVQH